MPVVQQSDAAGEPPLPGRGGRVLRGLAVWLGVWGLLLVWRWESLTSPPYWDSAMGLFVEANFLVESNFDYHRLWHDEPRFSEGGAGIYLVSVAPTLVALVLRMAPSTSAALAICHLGTLALAAAATTLLFQLLAPRIGALGAALTAAVVLTTPLFSAQVDLIGMDLPLATCGVLLLWLLERRHWAWVGPLTLLAFFIKLSGAVLTLAALGYFLLALTVRPFRGERPTVRRLWWGFGLSLLAICAECLTLDFLEALPQAAANRSPVLLTAGLASLAETRLWCPDLLAWFAVAVVLSGLTSTRWLLMVVGQARLARDWSLAAARVRQVLWNDPVPAVCWALALGSLAFLALFYTIPRYLALPLVAIWVVLARQLFARPHGRVGAIGFLSVVIAGNLLNQYGRFYPSLDQGGATPDDLRNGAQLERSREFWFDHRANLAAARRLAAESPPGYVVTSSPLVHFLALPRLGYVARPLAGYSLGRFQPRGFPGIERLRSDPPRRLVFATVRNRFTPLAEAAWPRLQPGDELIWTDQLRSPLEIFRTRPNDGEPGEAEKQAYLKRLFPWEDTLEQARQLLAAGRWQEAAAVYESVIDMAPERIEFRSELVAALLAAGRAAEAERVAAMTVELRPNHVPSRLQWIETMAATGNSAGVERALGELEQGDPDQPSIWLTRAKWEASHGDWPAARQAGERAHGLAASEPAPCLLLGQVEAAVGNREAARRWLARAIELDPQLAMAHYELGRLLIGPDPREAIAHLRQALALDPKLVQAANALAWIWSTDPADELRNGAAAVDLMEPLCRSPQSAPAAWLDTLAAAYAECGRWDQASRVAELAHERANATGDTALAERIAARRKSYASRQVYRRPASAP